MEMDELGPNLGSPQMVSKKKVKCWELISKSGDKITNLLLGWDNEFTPIFIRASMARFDYQKVTASLGTCESIAVVSNMSHAQYHNQCIYIVYYIQYNPTMTHKFLPVSSQIPMKMWMCLPPGPLPPPPPQLRGTIPWRTSNAAAAVSLGLPENRVFMVEIPT